MPNELDMNKLREEAARRAREMQAKARIPPPRKQQKPSAPEEKQESRPPETEAPAPSKEEPGLLDAFFQDKERTIILALLLLLSGEGENHELLFSLLFLLL